MLSASSARSSLASVAASDLEAARSTEHVKVICRIRPLNSRETSTGCKEFVAAAADDVLRIESQGKDMRFDGVLGPSQTQADVFDMVGRPIADAVLQGFNGSIFAYGQTGERPHMCRR